MNDNQKALEQCLLDLDLSDQSLIRESVGRELIQRISEKNNL